MRNRWITESNKNKSMRIKKWIVLFYLKSIKLLWLPNQNLKIIRILWIILLRLLYVKLKKFRRGRRWHILLGIIWKILGWSRRARCWLLLHIKIKFSTNLSRSRGSLILSLLAGNIQALMILIIQVVRNCTD